MRRALRRRRRLRIGLVQAIFVTVALVLALVMPSLDAGPDIDNDTVTTLLFSLAGGLIALITLVFSLLFLVVPYANTSLSPRLTLFRDDPVVWRSFAFFVAVFVFLTVSGLSLSGDREVSVYVAVIALLLVLIAAAAVRTLQFRAYRSLQFGGTIMDITAAGARLIGVLYQDAIRTDSPVHDDLPPVTADVRWPRGLCILRQVDVPHLLQLATRSNAVVEVRVGVGDELRRDVVVMVVRGHPAGDHTSSGRLLRMVEAGADRTFDQDPLFAFRLLVDIALRSLSSAINDPISAVQAIGGVHAMLHALIDRDLDIGRVADSSSEVRVLLKVPTWDDYLAIGIDELMPYVGSAPLARRRLTEMIDHLVAEAPPPRRAALEARQLELGLPSALTDRTMT